MNQTPPIRWPFIRDVMHGWEGSAHDVMNKWPADRWVRFMRLGRGGGGGGERAQIQSAVIKEVPLYIHVCVNRVCNVDH